MVARRRGIFVRSRRGEVERGLRILGGNGRLPEHFRRRRQHIRLRADRLLFWRVAGSHRTITQWVVHTRAAVLITILITWRGMTLVVNGAEGAGTAGGRLFREEQARQRRCMAGCQGQQPERCRDSSFHHPAPSLADDCPGVNCSRVVRPRGPFYCTRARSSAAAVVARPGASSSVTCDSSAGDLLARPACASARVAAPCPRSFSIRAR